MTSKEKQKLRRAMRRVVAERRRAHQRRRLLYAGWNTTPQWK